MLINTEISTNVLICSNSQNCGVRDWMESERHTYNNQAGAKPPALVSCEDLALPYIVEPLEGKREFIALHPVLLRAMKRRQLTIETCAKRAKMPVDAFIVACCVELSPFTEFYAAHLEVFAALEMTAAELIEYRDYKKPAIHGIKGGKQ